MQGMVIDMEQARLYTRGVLLRYIAHMTQSVTPAADPAVAQPARWNQMAIS